jgi:hypothetical protein
MAPYGMDFRKSIAEDSAFTLCTINASPRADRFLALLEDWLSGSVILMWRSIEAPTVWGIVWGPADSVLGAAR